MNIENLKFSKEHEWVKVEGTKAFVGISDYAQKALGDIVYVELPKVGATITSGKTFGSVESVKAVSDIFAPVSGKIVEINQALNDAPELLNQAPYENWIVAIEIANMSELGTLLNLKDYNAFCEKLK